MPSKLNKAVFLDRDGVINEERGAYTWELEDFKLNTDLIPALKSFQDAGFLMVVISNQGGEEKVCIRSNKLITCICIFSATLQIKELKFLKFIIVLTIRMKQSVSAGNRILSCWKKRWPDFKLIQNNPGLSVTLKGILRRV